MAEMTDDPIIGKPIGAEEEESAAPSTEPTGKSKRKIMKKIKKIISKIRERMNKNALLAASLNATFWGLGYFYNGNRKIFGILLMSSELVALVWLYMNPTIRVWKIITDPIVMISAILFFFALAYDAYMDAKEQTETKETSEM